MKPLCKEIIEVIDKEGFSVQVDKQSNGYCADLNQSTPLGEDWWVCVVFDETEDDFVDEIRDYYVGFDPEDEVELYIQNRGKNGIPTSIRALLDDQDWKDEKLKSLSDALDDYIYNKDDEDENEEEDEEEE